MANTITLRKQYSTLLDEVYKKASLTAVLDGPNDLVQEGANANEILIPKMSMQGHHARGELPYGKFPSLSPLSMFPRLTGTYGKLWQNRDRGTSPFLGGRALSALALRR